MTAQTDCIFCRIIAGEIPCVKLYEDDTTLAFMDINPANPGHALAIAKAHWENLMVTPGDVLSNVIRTAQRIAQAIDRSLTPGGINLVQANGPAALNSVPHLHFHILPRIDGDNLMLNWGHSPGDMEEIGQLAEKIRSALDATG